MFKIVYHTWSELILPPRKPKGDRRNIRRMAIAAIHAHQQSTLLKSDRWLARHLAEGCELCHTKLRYRAAS